MSNSFPSWLSKEFIQQTNNQNNSNNNTNNNNLNSLSSSSPYSYSSPPSSSISLDFDSAHLYRGIRSNANSTQNPTSFQSFPVLTNDISAKELSSNPSLDSTKTNETFPSPPQKSSGPSAANWLGIDTNVSASIPTPVDQSTSPILPPTPVFYEHSSSFYSRTSYSTLVDTLSSLFSSPDFSVDYTYQSEKSRMKCVYYQNAHSTVFNVYFYSNPTDSNTLLVEFQRRNGDSFAFYSLYTALCEKLKSMNINIKQAKEQTLPVLPSMRSLNTKTNTTTTVTSSLDRLPLNLNDSPNSSGIQVEATDSLLSVLFDMLNSAYLESKMNALDAYSVLFQYELNTNKFLSSLKTSFFPLLSSLLSSSDCDLARSAAALLSIISKTLPLNQSESIFIPSIVKSGLLPQTIDLIDQPSNVYSGGNNNQADSLLQLDTKRLLCELLCNLTKNSNCAQQMRCKLTELDENGSNSADTPLYDILLNVLDRCSHSEDRRIASICKTTANNLEQTK